MRPGVFAVAAVLVAFAGLARGQDEKAEKKADQLAPFNPFEKAELGDWFAFKTVLVEGEAKDGNTNLLEVVKIDGDEVSVKSTRGGRAKLFSKSKAPTIIAIIGGPPKLEVSESSTKDEKHTVSGKEFDCKAVHFTVAGADAMEGDVWFCPEVKVTGFVAIKLKNAGGGKRKGTIELEVVGYGTKEKDLWGLGRKDVEKSMKGPEEGSGSAPAPKEPKAEKPKKAENPKLATKLTVNLADLPLEEATAMVMELAGLKDVKVTFDDGVDATKKVSYKAQDKTVADVFDAIVGGAGYVWEAHGDTIVIKKAK